MSFQADTSSLCALRDLFADPAVAGALTSILGHDWGLHSHSYAHDRFPTSEVQREMVHKDGGFAGCYDGCVTRTRWALLLYYPQAVADDFGPTEVAHIVRRVGAALRRPGLGRGRSSHAKADPDDEERAI